MITAKMLHIICQLFGLNCRAVLSDSVNGLIYICWSLYQEGHIRLCVWRRQVTHYENSILPQPIFLNLYKIVRNGGLRVLFFTFVVPVVMGLYPMKNSSIVNMSLTYLCLAMTYIVQT